MFGSARKSWTLAALAAVSAGLGCNGAGSPNGAAKSASTASAPASTTAGSTSSAATSAGATVATAWSGALARAYAGAASALSSATASLGSMAAASAGTTTPASVASSASASTTLPGAASWSYPGTLAAAATTSTGGVTLSGSVPADPNVGFSGSLFLTGQAIVPGSSVLVQYQGMTVGVLPATFYSSELVGLTVSFAASGSYTLTAVAPDGSTSTPLTLTVGSGSGMTASLTAAPELQMVWPPSFDTNFTGTVWIMGDGFLPGATLTGDGPTGPFVAPLLFVNSNTLGWVTATPVAGTYTLQVANPTLLESSPVQITVGAVTAPTGTYPAPTLVYAQSSVASPFLGTLRIFGNDFLPGAELELTDASGNTTSTPLVFVASDEVWWELVYPETGTYTALVRNPDGQATTTWSFSVN